MKPDFKKLADGAPNKRNGSPQFPDDGLGAHAVHAGRKGGNKLDPKQGTDVGKAMLQALAAGGLQIVSVSPPDYADPAKLSALNDDVANGSAVQTKVVTSEIAEDGQPRMKSLAISFSKGPISSLVVTYKLP